MQFFPIWSMYSMQIQLKIPASYLIDKDKLILKYTGKAKDLKHSIQWEKKKGGPMPSNVKTYNKAIIIQ